MGVGVDRGGVQDDEMGENGEDMYRQSRTDPKDHCITYMKLGFRTIKTLWSITKETPELITQKSIILQQLIQNCLNSCLYRLVGPKCLQLKGSGGKDFETYHFFPKELLSMVCDMYSMVFSGSLAANTQDRVLSLIVGDERAYSEKTFTKAQK